MTLTYALCQNSYFVVFAQTGLAVLNLAPGGIFVPAKAF